MYVFFNRPLLFLNVFIALFTANAAAQNIDIDILKSINPRHPSSGFWSATSSSGYLLAGSVSAGQLVYGIIEKDKQAQYSAYETFISIGISAVVTESLKRIVDRTRPADEYPNDIFVIKPEHGRAFPSGHATIAFAAATNLSLEYKKWYITVPAYTWAGLVGYSRMYKGYHAPSDILGGAAVGIGSGVLSHWLCKKLFNPADKKQMHDSVVN